MPSYKSDAPCVEFQDLCEYYGNAQDAREAIYQLVVWNKPLQFVIEKGSTFRDATPEEIIDRYFTPADATMRLLKEIVFELRKEKNRNARR